MSVIHAIEANEVDLGSITFKCNRLHYNYFAIFMITLHYDYINFQMQSCRKSSDLSDRRTKID